MDTTRSFHCLVALAAFALSAACGSDSSTPSEQAKPDAAPSSTDAGADAGQTGPWACVDQPDEREVPKGAVTFQLKVVDGLTSNMPADLEVKMCGDAKDHDCSKPPADVALALDPTKGLVTLTGVAQDTLIHLQLTAPGYISTDFYSSRTLRGELAAEPVQTGMFSEGLITTIQTIAQFEWDQENTALLAVRTIDCEGVLAAGVKVTNEPSAGTVIRYNNETDSGSDLMLKETSAAGGLLVANVPGATKTTVTATVAGEKTSSFALTPRAGWFTHLNLYPSTK